MRYVGRHNGEVVIVDDVVELSTVHADARRAAHGKWRRELQGMDSGLG